MPWFSSRPPGPSSDGEAARVGVDVRGADVLDHPDRGDRVELLPAQLAVVHDADLDLVGDAVLGRRALARAAACGSHSVIPVTCTPWCSAACTANEPQPQPTSSTRSPGFSASLRQTVSRLLACASSSDCSGVSKIAQL